MKTSTQTPAPIQTLMNEHRLIEKVLFSLEAYVSNLEAKKPVDSADLKSFVTFIQDFADRAHHAKEETMLFETMVTHGFPKTHGPIAVMLHEHDQGREQVNILAQYSGGSSSNWNTADVRRIADAAHFFAQMLADHIQKEDQILYQMAIEHLPTEAMTELEKRFNEFQKEQSARSTELQQLGSQLFEKYGSSFDPRKLQSNCGCGSGGCC